jgi:hypothetical protein
MRLTKPQIVICFVTGIVMAIAGYIVAVHTLSLTKGAMILHMAGVLTGSILSLMAIVVILNFVSDRFQIWVLRIRGN